MMHVEQSPFSGPMDLLLDLVEKDRVDIYEISISAITEKFLQAMQTLAISSEELSDFIRMASMLVLMKAKTLAKDQSTDEEEEILTREELIERLVLYQQYKRTLPFFQERAQQAAAFFAKPAEDLSAFSGEPVEETIIADVQLLLQHMEQALARLASDEATMRTIDGLVQETPYSLEKMERRIREKLKQGDGFTLEDLLDETPTRSQVIALFLSLLELTRTKEVRLHQRSDEQILVERRVQEAREVGNDGRETDA